MSKNSQWKLTENGVLALYEQHFKKEVRVQVIFKTYIDSTCYLRVSDGQHLSPVVIIMCQMHSHTMFSVGAIIAIKERRLVPFDDYVEDDGPQWFMKDYGVHHLYIERYILVASHTDVGQVLGSLHHNGDYRENMKLMLSVLSKWIPEDEQLQWEHDSNEIHLRQEERDRLREQGNSFFKQNDFNRAIDFYNVAKVEDPYDYRVWSNCSHAYFKLKEYLPAQLHAIVATKLNPFFEKAYYRAGQAALRERRWWDGEEYAKCGIFICGETKELRQILDDSINIPNDNQGGLLNSFISDGIRGFVRNHTESIINSTLESVDLKSAHQKSRCIVRDIQEQFMKKKHADLSGALVKEQKKETKKINKKSKKLGEDVATTSAAAATASTTASGSKEQKSKGEEERKHFQDKKEEKNKKSKINIEETFTRRKKVISI
ncbi:hypothetical protein O3P69_005300 [Scylla paramamosain]|uniref:Uncharacterized protein n=1 Tax=Scylla paramamosain TaxID=85552 RepID=A0AAW0UAX7_SCYPA